MEGEGTKNRRNGFPPTLPTSPPITEQQRLGCRKLVAEAKVLFCVDGLSLAGDFPLPVAHVGRVAHRDVAALFQSVRDNAAVAPILEPVGEFGIGHAGDAAQRYRVGVAEQIESVRQFRFLWRSA